MVTPLNTWAAAATEMAGEPVLITFLWARTARAAGAGAYSQETNFRLNA